MNDVANGMLEKIQDLIPIPPVPVDVDPEAMRRNEVLLGVSFPDEFKAFAKIYGTGRLTVGNPDIVAATFIIYSPAFPHYPAMQRQFFEGHDAMRECGYLDADQELGLFPDPGGLISFAWNDNGVDWAFKTKGDPNDWTICFIWCYDADGYRLFNFGFLQFLLGFIDKSLYIGAFDDPWDPQKDVSFEPGLLIPWK